MSGNRKARSLLNKSDFHVFKFEKPINFENANLLFAEHFFTWIRNKTGENY